MIYSEDNTSYKRAACFLIAVVVCVYLVPIGMTPVRDSEARLSFVANRGTWDTAGKKENFLHEKSPYMLLHRALYRVMTVGESEPAPPSLSHVSPSPSEMILPALAPRRALWAFRLLSLLALGLLTFPCVFTANRELEGGVAAVAAGIIIGALPVMALCHFNARTVFLAGLINAAWFSWYFFARQRKSWDRAWAVAGLFLLVACLEGGSLMLLVFYFPLVFLRRPFRIWQRMLNPVHLVTLGAILIFSVFWSHFSHAEEILQMTRHFSVDEPGEQSLSFLARFMVIPIGIILVLAPWPAIIWPAYCAAFKPLEKNAVFTHFLRTLIAPLFLFTWVIARMKGLPLLLMIPPLAALAAVNYELLVRRHIQRLRRFVRFFRRLIIILSGVILVVWIAHAMGLPRFAGVKLVSMLWGIMYLVLGIGWCGLGRFSRYRLPFWGELLSAAVGLACLAQSVIVPVGDFLSRDPVADAAELMKRVPVGAPVYLLPVGDRIKPAFYTRHPLIQISSPELIPETAPVVYVWGSQRPPLLETRIWEKVSEELPQTRGTRLSWGKTTEKGARVFKFECGWRQGPEKPKVSCIYRGVLDPESQRLLTP